MNSETLTLSAIESRRVETKPAQHVVFGVSSLYGLSKESISLPVSEGKTIDSGQICVTIDPESDPASNLGMINFEEKHLVVSYGIQAVFPGLFELITTGNHDPRLLNPVRARATDECTVLSNYEGWQALGCLEFLPGSVWSGATGG